MQNVSALNCKDIVIMRQKKVVIKSLSCVVPQGIMAAIVGPNGAGKSTLLHAIVGLHTDYQGTIQIYGQPFTHIRPLIAYVPQRALVDWNFPTTVFEVVMMGRYVHKSPWSRINKYDYDCVFRALEKVDLLGYKDQSIGDLSGGQQQRVFIARALAQEATFYILDEPFAGVDIKTEQIIINLLKEECRSGKTALLVHHDISTLHAYFDWALFLNMYVIDSGFINSFNIQNIINKTYGMRYGE
jgi:manganese/zinc/iron transport system ATP- binding protein